jgi:hypothetical protein
LIPENVFNALALMFHMQDEPVNDGTPATLAIIQCLLDLPGLGRNLDDSDAGNNEGQDHAHIN